MINILHLIHKYRGDYPLLNQQVNLDRSQFRTVVCYLSGEDDGRNGLDGAGVETVYLGFKPQHLRFHNLSLLRRLKTLIDAQDIHVVNCQQHRATPIGVLASLMATNKPSVVSTLHGLGFARTLRRKLFNWLLYKKVFRLIGISHGVSQDILRNNWGLTENKVVTVQNGLVFEPFLQDEPREVCRAKVLPERSRDFWFGTVGRLSAVKNHHNLIKAFADVRREIPEAILVIAGSGDLEPELRRQAAAAGLEERVVFLGHRTDIPRLLHCLDVFLLPSLREGFGLALLEAMASRLPVIASRVGGIPEIFGEENFGIMIDPNSPEQLAKAMKTMAALPAAQLEAWGERARRRALEHFTADRMIADYQRVYLDAYRDRQSRHPRREAS
jgi:glycosyltransferase involved in cell wall biosynthesis